jgi:hypothetical protein
MSRDVTFDEFSFTHAMQLNEQLIHSHSFEEDQENKPLITYDSIKNIHPHRARYSSGVSSTDEEDDDNVRDEDYIESDQEDNNDDDAKVNSDSEK